MNTPTKVAVAASSGYLLGRSKKLKLAIVVGGALAGRRIAADPKVLVTEGLKLMDKSPELKELQGQVSGQLMDAARGAAIATATQKIEQLNESLASAGEVVESTAKDAEAATDEALDDEAAADEPAEADEEPADDEPADEAPPPKKAPAKRASTTKKAPAKEAATKRASTTKAPAKRANSAKRSSSAKSSGSTRSAGSATGRAKSTRSNTSSKRPSRASGSSARK